MMDTEILDALERWITAEPSRVRALQRGLKRGSHTTLLGPRRIPVVGGFLQDTPGGLTFIPGEKVKP